MGPGPEGVVAAIEALSPHIVGADARTLFADMGSFARRLLGISQFRWLGPEKGVMHMAIGAVLNAVWDLYAKSRGVPVWQLLAEMTPGELVSLVDVRYIVDALPPAMALEMLEAEAGRR